MSKRRLAQRSIFDKEGRKYKNRLADEREKHKAALEQQQAELTFERHTFWREKHEWREKGESLELTLKQERERHEAAILKERKEVEAFKKQYQEEYNEKLGREREEYDRALNKEREKYEAAILKERKEVEAFKKQYQEQYNEKLWREHEECDRAQNKEREKYEAAILKQKVADLKKRQEDLEAEREQHWLALEKQKLADLRKRQEQDRAHRERQKSLEIELTRACEKHQREAKENKVKLEALQNRFDTVLNLALTSPFSPRVLLLMEERRLKRQRPNSFVTASTACKFIQTLDARHLTLEHLDIILTTDQAESFVSDIDPTTFAVSTRICVQCNVPRISSCSMERGDAANGTLPPLEYPKPLHVKQFFGADVDIDTCFYCLQKGLKTSIRRDLWTKLDSKAWLTWNGRDFDPNDTERFIDIALSWSLLVNRTEMLDMLLRASHLRKSLKTLDPRPSPEALSESATLHKQLVESNMMADPLANDCKITDVSLKGPEIIMGKIERDNHTIPVFAGFFKRTGFTKDCSICAKTYQELELNVLPKEELSEVFKGFEGPWTSQLGLAIFPIKGEQQCQHDLDVCRSCWEEQLDAEVKKHARNPDAQFSCFTCERVFSWAEFQILASKETRDKWDRYQLIQYLSAEPNFRWCLNSQCNNGEVYEIGRSFPRISCTVCETVQCFKHGKWHQGLSCAEFEDPPDEEIQQWLKKNTKRCPRCEQPFEKNGGCFHMKCKNPICNMEFCWECLANWEKVKLSGGHNPGCIFQFLEVSPTRITGTEISERLREQARRNGWNGAEEGK